MTDFDRASLDRILPSALGSPDWDDVISRSGACQGRRRWPLVALAAVILAAGLLVTPAFGIGGRLLALIEGAPARPEVRAPAWSPDGRKIAFLSRRSESTFDLDVVNADGSGQRTLFHGATREPPSWSPDGRKIVFEGLRHSSIYTVNADGSGRQQLARNSRDPAWSPAGPTIAFLSAAIYLMDADGSRLRNLTRPKERRDLAWSPDGRRLAFLQTRRGCGPSCYDVYVVNSDGSGLRNLTAKLTVGIRLSLGPASDPAWSPDGQTIAFARLNPDVGKPIYVVKADGSRLRNLTPKPVGSYADPAWSPDGRKIAFVNRDGNSEVYVMNANGHGQRNLTRDPAYDADPAWSPDGRKIAFVSNRDGKYGIYLMNADGSGQQRLVQHNR
ncbi:MAG TPA: LpqB family beta-propeller domain-containing protein [Gaiellaceae bacterium]|jgi:TolB protein